MNWIDIKDKHPPFCKLLMGHWKYRKEGGKEVQEEICVFYCTFATTNLIYYNREIRGSYCSSCDPPNKWSEFEVPKDYDFHYQEEDEKDIEDYLPDLDWQESIKKIWLKFNYEY